ncbi:2OG-Fe(II) oxygenase [Spongiimicrobium salis]|uniref:2OG-Fe(II) oxygenase n=1 Tax=Spongiimicrobium salis TaxID=1667022 RepID=UPI00374D5C44
MHTITKINGLFLIEIENFLSHTEINTLLQPRKQQFKKAISHYPDYYRNNDRLVEDDQELANTLFQKVKQHQLPHVEASFVGLNKRIRFCRYQKNQFFDKHQDGVFHQDDMHRSQFTFLLYLNDNSSFDAGETHFYTTKTSETPVKTIRPKKGKLVIFDHQIWHKGATVTLGNKYILRSDVMIKSKDLNTHHQGYIWKLLKLNETAFLSCGRDRKIKHWNAQLELQNTFEIHTKSVLKIVSFGKNEYLSCSRDFTIKKWNLSGEVLAVIHLPEMILNMLCLPNERIIAVGTSGKVYVLSAALKVIKRIAVHKAWVWDAALLDEATLISCCEAGKIQLTHLSSEKSRCIYEHEQPLCSINAEKKKLILIGTKDGTLIQWCTRTKTSTKIKVHDDIIRSIVYYGKYILSCGEDNKLMLTDMRSGRTKELWRSCNFLQDIMVMNKAIYVAGYDGMIHKVKI